MLQKTMFLVAVAGALLMGHVGARAQEFPNQLIRIIVPYAPAGLPDVLARMVGQKISESTGQRVIIENKPGAGGVIASQYVAKSAPDGYTVMLAGNADYAITPALNAKLPYDPQRDFAPITQALGGAYFLVVNSALGVSTVQELIALAKQRPGVINYGSPGAGQLHHLAMAQFVRMTGVNIAHIPYKGIVQTTPALLAGDVSVMFATLTSIAPHVKTGKLRILAVGSPQRSALMPEIPTVSESGLPGFEVGVSQGFVVPAGTPKIVVERLNTEFVKALKSSEVMSKMVGFGMEVIASSPEQFAQRIRKDQEHYARLVREIGLTIY
jgi:tripartite-type tricarboxylate transporter receptor subunit TctC